MHDIDI